MSLPPKSAPPSARSGEAPQRIAKLLARAGVASRREIERMIGEGRIAIDGVAIDTPATILTSLAGVTVDGNAVAAAEPARLFLFHKPRGVLTTERDPAGRPTIYDRLPKDLPRLMPVGRLDLNTEGLLLMTTDGELKRLLELPATGVERAYRARAYGNVTQAQLEDLIEGVEIEGIRYGSIDANLERRTGANVWIEMILTEGKNREVRRVLEYLDLEVSRLIRTRYGPFILGDLPVGGIGEVRQRDLAAFRKNPTSKTLQPMHAPDTAPSTARASIAKVGMVEPERPSTRPQRPARPQQVQRPARPAPTAVPARGGRRERDPSHDTIAKPARAARVRAHRDATGSTTAAEWKPQVPRGKYPEPRSGARPARPPRTRK
ncbi:Pseudouridine synthase [Sphingomonas sp. EC-HK361]|uniref:pseudouridine synthase n=1 Tax=Sphingomonas sp. EC-HK361 TaxID=2038397 RepID=UPI0012594449|nr:pseudouridine synthase [Sphingomonas sp. EC-HK361]VVT07662.1 Pseudouridine synthase [Sphingomonas sp. EC-HK361]